MTRGTEWKNSDSILDEVVRWITSSKFIEPSEERLSQVVNRKDIDRYYPSQVITERDTSNQHTCKARKREWEREVGSVLPRDESWVAFSVSVRIRTSLFFRVVFTLTPFIPYVHLILKEKNSFFYIRNNTYPPPRRSTYIYIFFRFPYGLIF